MNIYEQINFILEYNENLISIINLIKLLSSYLAPVQPHLSYSLLPCVGRPTPDLVAFIVLLRLYSLICIKHILEYL
ncbi:hypothetical protein VNO77_16453 [Canavalia gladiata]|uniref:Uncharacterized protein n=1 Tax=Canavalia gladiata TaxID=3824 RepID=A0AAN9M116_CANGL